MMNTQNTLDDQPEDRIVREYYQQLKVVDPAERESMLDRWLNNPLPVAGAPYGSRHVRSVAIAVAVLVCLVAVSAVREFGALGNLYGADDLPGRLVQVNSFRMTGWQYVPNPAGVNLPSIRIPFELTIQRPGRYRRTFMITKQKGARRSVATGIRVCDGEYEWEQNDTAKRFSGQPIGKLDAILKSEELAQGPGMRMLLGPPSTKYVRVGQEQAKGINCDVFAANIEQNSTVRLWIDPQTGWPVRIMGETLIAAGKWTPLYEINEIDINGALPDSLFTLSPPNGYVDKTSKHENSPTISAVESPSNAVLTEITMQPTGGGGSNDQRIEKWYGFLLSPNSAAFAWKRTIPETTGKEPLNWLNNVDLVFQSGNTSRPLKHKWVRPPQAEQWLWSIVKTADGQPFDRGMIQITYQSKDRMMNNFIEPLFFSDSTLDRLLQAADKLHPVPDNSQPLTLKLLREMVNELK